jgi:hypothetical protein
MDDAPKKTLSGTAKIDATTEAAYGLIDARTAAREAKTARLRELRLAKEAADAANVPVKKKQSKKPIL